MVTITGNIKFQIYQIWKFYWILGKIYIW